LTGRTLASTSGRRPSRLLPQGHAECPIPKCWSASREEPKALVDSLRNAGLDVAFGDKDWQKPGSNYREPFIAAARDAVALIGMYSKATPLDRATLAACQRLRYIGKYTAGVDDIDTDAASEFGVMVCHAPTEANCFGVAETTIAMILALLKRVRERDADVRAGNWRGPNLMSVYLGHRMTDNRPGLTVGIVGLGRIGTRVADLLAPWRVRLVAYDPYIEPARFLLSGATAVDYHSLLRESDVVTFHTPLTKETRNMLGERELALMKPTAVLINAARGGLIDEDALARTLAAGKIRAAAIDAFATEPLPMDSLLRQIGDRILLSPHSASFNEDAQLGPGIEWIFRSALTALKGQVPDNVYNREVIPAWKDKFGGMSLTE
jgi:D-3-phosphoglycerate dehydrogenase / 2-oxoglutarate reductase